MTGNDMVGFAAGITLMVSFLPQVIKTIQTRKVDDISIALLVLSLISGCLYEVYAYNLKLLPVIIMNGAFTLSVVVQLIYTYRFRKKLSSLTSGTEK